MEIDNLWKAEKWEPEKLMALYKRAGAKYFVVAGQSPRQLRRLRLEVPRLELRQRRPRRRTSSAPGRRSPRAHGLRFGVSNHSAHAWHWFQTAYGYDGEGPLAGVRYDAFTLTKADGKGKWWEGLDPAGPLHRPQHRHARRHRPRRQGRRGLAEKNDRPWTEKPPAMNPAFTEKWFLRCQDLVDKYQPDLLYFDNIGELPLGQAGLDIAAHYLQRQLPVARRQARGRAQRQGIERGPAPPALVEDYERGCQRRDPAHAVADRHLHRRLALQARASSTQHRYKTVAQVVHMLVNIVSKNGNLLLSIPVRGDGTIDEDEVAFLEGMAEWMDVNGEGIFGTRPWKVFGEGPAKRAGAACSTKAAPPTAPQDIRFTTKGDTLYAFLLGWPTDRRAVIESLASTSPHVAGRKVADVSLLGDTGQVEWTQDDQGLTVQLPATPPSEHAVALRIKGVV